MSSNWMRQSIIAVTAIAGLALVSSSQAAILLSDSFNDGGLTNGTDVSDTAWFRNNNDALSTVSVPSGSGEMEWAFYYSSSPVRGLVGTFQNAAGLVTPYTLQAGYSLTLSLDYHFTAAPTLYTTVLNKGLKFGLYDGSPGGYVSAADYGADTFDDGYIAVLDFLPGADGAMLGKETEDIGHIGSSNIATLSSSSTNLPAPGTSTHTAVFQMWRHTATPNQLDFVATVDGTQYLSGSDSSSIITTFDEVFIGLGGYNGTLRLDNILVEANPIPEPASAGLLLLGAAALGLRRRHG